MLLTSLFLLSFAAKIIVDRETGRSRGFAFVTFTSTEEASNAMQLDGQVNTQIFQLLLVIRCHVTYSVIPVSFLCSYPTLIALRMHVSRPQYR